MAIRTEKFWMGTFQRSPHCPVIFANYVSCDVCNQEEKSRSLPWIWKLCHALSVGKIAQGVQGRWSTSDNPLLTDFLVYETYGLISTIYGVNFGNISSLIANRHNLYSIGNPRFIRYIGTFRRVYTQLSCLSR